MKHIGLATLLACANLAMAQSPEALVSWKLDGLSRAGNAASTAPSTQVHTGIESSVFSLGAGFEATAWHDALTVYAKDLMSDLSGAVIMEHYYSFTVTPKKGKEISYSSIFNRVAINTGNMEAGASIQFALMSSATGFAPATEGDPLKELATFTVDHPAGNDKATTVMKTFDVSSVEELQNVGSPIEFRIYAVLVDGVGNRMGYGHIFYQDGQDDLRVMGTLK